jgi:hypothetical protein
MAEKRAQRKTFFGLAALVTAIVSLIFLAAFFGVSQLNITPATFSRLNNLTASVSCLAAPLALLLGVAGYTRANDSKRLSLLAMSLVGLPYLVLFVQFIASFSR